jgi:hypothetical protein
MLDLVLWYFAMALTPWALDLAWKVVRGVGHFIEPRPVQVKVAGLHHVAISTLCQVGSGSWPRSNSMI